MHARTSAGVHTHARARTRAQGDTAAPLALAVIPSLFGPLRFAPPEHVFKIKSATFDFYLLDHFSKAHYFALHSKAFVKADHDHLCSYEVWHRANCVCLDNAMQLSPLPYSLQTACDNGRSVAWTSGPRGGGGGGQDVGGSGLQN